MKALASFLNILIFVFGRLMLMKKVKIMTCARLSEISATFFLLSEAYSVAAISRAFWDIEENGLAYTATTYSFSPTN